MSGRGSDQRGIETPGDRSHRPRSSNPPFSGWGGVFGDQAVAAAMIDRIVPTLKGAS